MLDRLEPGPPFSARKGASDTDGQHCRSDRDVICRRSPKRFMNSRSNSPLFRIASAGALLLSSFCPSALSQQATPLTWQDEVRREAQAQNWAKALAIVDSILKTHPQDDDVKAWHARLLLWSGDVRNAQTEFLSLTNDSPKDPDIWQGLSAAYERENQWTDALHAIDRSESLDSHRADLHAQRARILRALNNEAEARQEFLQALSIDPTNTEAKAGLVRSDSTTKQELRIGSDNDLLNYTSAYESEWLSLASSWSQHWSTNMAGNFFQRGGSGAGKFVGSVTRKTASFGAITAGGAIGHDNAIIPRSEAFFGFDRGWRLSENRPFRGIEATHDEHWYWYSTARIFTLSGGALVYLPRDWTWSITATGVRSSFPRLPVGWQPSGVSRLNFPLLNRLDRSLSGNVFFGVGAEDFALVDQIGSFASQSYGGGFRFRFTATEDVTGYAAFQQRTQDRTDKSFGMSYGIHF